ncbi:hypothetical protein [Mesorhizobium sp. Cs1299R1N3]|uniref:hypothetical protein n=1 Tax=Mesorhizobium sp. Cs1299R1N3 TaxID=3015173 RepID=UPI00301C70E0
MLFHATSSKRAYAILRDGFRDGQGHYMTDISLRGVWLSDRPLDANGGVVLAEETTILAVELGVPLSKWCVPSDLISQFATIRVAQQG